MINLYDDNFIIDSRDNKVTNRLIMRARHCDAAYDLNRLSYL